MMRFLLRPLPYRLHNRSVVTVLIVINVCVFVVLQLYRPFVQYLAVNPIFFSQRFFFWTPITYMFTHYGFSHILFNMLGLYFFGRIIERHWGSDEFLFLYLSVGVLSGLLSLVTYFFTASNSVFLLGASGAVYGILLVFATLHPTARLYVFGLFPISARILILIYIGIQILSFFGGGQNTGVSYLTHLFGLGIAWLYLLFRQRIDPAKILFDRLR